MREILFRGKIKDDGDWEEGGLVVFTDYDSGLKEYWIVHPGQTVDFRDDREYEVVPETVGQYTGLTDKNGEKIFEGDIVKTKYGRLCIVVWFSSQACNGWDLETIRTVENCVHTKYPDAIDLYKKENLEIVGNIHDNPELLEED